MKGRRPVPTALKLLRGNPGHHPINEHEPSIPAGLPEPPEFLDDVAKTEWNRNLDLMISKSMLTPLDWSFYAAYCYNFSQFIRRSAELEKTGTLIEAPSGYPIQNPLISIVRSSLEMMYKFGAELGLSPAQRSRLRVDTPESGDEVDPYMDIIRKKQRIRASNR